MEVSKVLYVFIKNERTDDVWVRNFVINIHVLQLVVLENVLEEAVAILLIFIIKAYNSVQAFKEHDAVTFVGVAVTVNIF